MQAKTRGNRLLKRWQLEQDLWLNEHVETAYRPPHLPLSAYLKSVFEWNNETINIWSHLVGFTYFSWLQVETNLNILPAVQASLADHFVASIAILGIQICMMLSTSYHIFGSANVRQRQKWLRLDVFGITAGLIGMYVMGVYTAFYCFEDLKSNYLTIITGLFAVSAYIPSRNDFLRSKLFGTRIGYLHLTYIGVAAFGICPTVHWVFLHGGLSSPHVGTWLPNIFIMYTLIGCAFLFYASMIPERLVPGFFDVVGCSHQWWHVLILAAMVFWIRSGLNLLTLHRSQASHCLIAVNSSNSTLLQRQRTLDF